MVRAEVTFRRGVAADADALASFGSQSFVDAYGTSTSPHEVALHVARTYSAERQLSELNDAGSWTILGDREEEIVGAALVRWLDPPLPIEPGAKWAEVKRFYVARPYWRTGVSGDLMAEVLRSIHEGEGTGVWLQVWEDAGQAIGFYRKWGFREAGRVPFLLGTVEQSDLLMVRTSPST